MKIIRINVSLTPSVRDFFQSYFYSNTYLPTVDISDKALEKKLLSHIDAKAAAKAQELISKPEVQKILSEPLTFEKDHILQNNAVLEKHGFKLLSAKYMDANSSDTIPFYSVVEHPELPGWVIKSGADRVLEDCFMQGPYNELREMAHFTSEDSLLRIPMAERIEEVAKDAKIKVVVPKKGYVAYANVDPNDKQTKKYCIVCEKVKVLSKKEMIQKVLSMTPIEQKTLAQRICLLILKAGIADGAAADNMRLNEKGELVFLDTEPSGLLKARKGLWDRIFGHGASIEKSARIGLAILFKQSSQVIGLENFSNSVREIMNAANKPKLSKWKIALNIATFGLYSLVCLVMSVAKVYFTKKNFKKYKELDIAFQNRSREIQTKPIEEQKKLLKDHWRKCFPLQKLFYQHIEDVPYVATYSVAAAAV